MPKPDTALPDVYVQPEESRLMWEPAIMRTLHRSSGAARRGIRRDRLQPRRYIRRQHAGSCRDKRSVATTIALMKTGNREQGMENIMWKGCHCE